MIRLAIAALMVGLILGTTHAATESLSLERARLLVTAAGFSPGKVFVDEGQRYLLSHLETKSTRPNVFLVEIEITPLRQ